MSLKIASLNEKSIYEIFRSCRLCGAGGGYKMPIIQNVVDLHDNDVELCQKIKECVQIEIVIDDKMPPLICELCIDKINDFYAFQTLCKNTNNQTRARLGLPSQNRSSSPVEESILGVTEALCERDSSDNEPLVPRSAPKMIKSKPQPKSKKVSVKVEKEQTPPIRSRPSLRRVSSPPTIQPERAKNEPRPIKDRRGSSRQLREQSNGNVKSSKSVISAGSKSRLRFESSSSPSPPPVRMTRTKTSEELFDELNWESSSSNVRHRDSSPLLVERAKDRKPTSKPGPKSKQAASQSPKGNSKIQPTKETKKDKVEDEKTKSAKKRAFDIESPKPVPSKKSKPTPAKSKEKRDPPKPAPKALATPPVPVSCEICSETFMSNAARQNHARTHVVTFTEPRLACNACEDWYSTYDEAAAHHKWHRTGPNPYTCSVCTFDYDTLNEYNVHIEKYSCRKFYEEPDVQCLVCWNDFPTKTSLENHTCLGEAGRPGGKCSKCGKMYALLKDLINHESDCTKERRAHIDPEILYKIKPLQIVVAKCDKLLERKIGLRYNVANVPNDYGVDPDCYYPYLTKRGLKRIKTEKTPFDGMVSINDDIRKQFEEYANSDFQSDEDMMDFSEENRKRVKKLSQLCLKAMSNLENFSKSLNSKRKKVKPDTAFDDLLNDDQPAFSQSYNFDSLIDSLDKNDDSGEESVIKGFGVAETDKVQSEENKQDLSKSCDVSAEKDEISPKKDSSFDIESILRSGKNDTEHQSTTEAMDVDINKSDNVNTNDESKDESENAFKPLENSNKSPIKESSASDVTESNDFALKHDETSTETDKTNDLNEIFETNLTSFNGIDNSEQKSQNNDTTINQSVSESKTIDEKIDSDNINVESNGVSEKADISNNFYEKDDKINDSSVNVEDKELMAAINEQIGENL